MQSMRILQIMTPIVFFFFVSGCAGIKPATFENSTPKLDPVKFFVGHTHSSGVIENRGGKPTIRITTTTAGVLKDGIIYIEQDLYPEGGKINHRSWQLRQINKHHVDATANDIHGVAHGLLYGDAFSWTFRHTFSERKIIKHARMSQNMYLMPDGQTLIIRSVFRKFGIVVAQITEQFTKD